MKTNNEIILNKYRSNEIILNNKSLNGNQPEVWVS